MLQYTLRYVHGAWAHLMRVAMSWKPSIFAKLQYAKSLQALKRGNKGNHSRERVEKLINLSNQRTKHSNNQVNDRTLKHSSISQSIKNNEFTKQRTNQPANQPFNQPMKQPFSHRSKRASRGFNVKQKRKLTETGNEKQKVGDKSRVKK